jgi:hypothetical protein
MTICLTDELWIFEREMHMSARLPDCFFVF